MFKNHPKLAKEFAAKTKDITSLPEHVKPKSRKDPMEMLKRGIKGRKS